MAIPELFHGKAEKLAKGVEKRNANVFKNFAQYFTVLDSETLEAFLEHEYRDKKADYLKKREEGRANDKESKAPGITVYVTLEGAEIVAKMCALKNYRVLDEEVATQSDSVVSIEFPTGTYRMDDLTAEFWAKEDKDGKPTKSFPLPYEAIIRVEGDSGELWQNKRFNWDGTQKG
jgi:hypothetical protein